MDLQDDEEAVFNSHGDEFGRREEPASPVRFEGKFSDDEQEEETEERKKEIEQAATYLDRRQRAKAFVTEALMNRVKKTPTGEIDLRALLNYTRTPPCIVHLLEESKTRSLSNEELQAVSGYIKHVYQETDSNIPYGLFKTYVASRINTPVPMVAEVTDIEDIENLLRQGGSPSCKEMAKFGACPFTDRQASIKKALKVFRMIEDPNEPISGPAYINFTNTINRKANQHQMVVKDLTRKIDLEKKQLDKLGQQIGTKNKKKKGKKRRYRGDLTPEPEEEEEKKEEEPKDNRLLLLEANLEKKKTALKTMLDRPPLDDTSSLCSEFQKCVSSGIGHSNHNEGFINYPFDYRQRF
jgi:hypothetical protein